MERISVFLADWQVLFREGIHFILSGEEDIDVTGEATNSKEALAFIQATPPTVAILNADHGKPNGIEVARRIKQNLLKVSVILIMDNEDEKQLFSALKSGASICLTKDIDPDDLVNITRKVAQGIYPISEVLLRPGIASLVIDEFKIFSLINEQMDNLLARLTLHETQILRHIADGSSREQVARILGMNEEAIRQQLDLIRTKLVANDHNREVIETVRGRVPIIPRAKPAVEYITKDEFAIFKESLRERFKSFTGELS